MNGVLIVSLDTGMLLFSQYFTRNFGLEEGGAGGDPMQLSGIIFTLYKTASEIRTGSDENQALTYFTQGKCTLHFVEGDTAGVRYLLVISLRSTYDIRFAKDIARRMSDEFKRLHPNPQTGQSTKTKLKISPEFKDTILRILDNIHSELAFDIYQSVVPGLTWMSICLPESIPGFWSDAQLHDWFREQLQLYQNTNSSDSLPSLPNGVNKPPGRGPFNMGGRNGSGDQSKSTTGGNSSTTTTTTSTNGNNSGTRPSPPCYRHVLLGSGNDEKVTSPPLDLQNAVVELHKNGSRRRVNSTSTNTTSSSTPKVNAVSAAAKSIRGSISATLGLGKKSAPLDNILQETTINASVSATPIHIVEAHDVVLVWVCPKGASDAAKADPRDCSCCLNGSPVSHTALGSFCRWSRTVLLTQQQG